MVATSKIKTFIARNPNVGRRHKVNIRGILGCAHSAAPIFPRLDLDRITIWLRALVDRLTMTGGSVR
jgi:hypothetical protein